MKNGLDSGFKFFFGVPSCVPAVSFDRSGFVLEVSSEVEGELFVMPGFVDSHVHIESSMLVPSEFAKVSVQFGVVATVSDPHEIANVLGVDGIEYMRLHHMR